MSFSPDELEHIKTIYPDLCDTEGKVDLENENAKKLLKDWEEPKAFDKIGYARPLGGFFYEFHDRFPIPHEEAQKEAIELMKIRHIKDKVIKKLYSST